MPTMWPGPLMRKILRGGRKPINRRERREFSRMSHARRARIMTAHANRRTR